MAVGLNHNSQDDDRVKFVTAIRGGNWNNGSNAGVFALNLNNAPSNTNVNIGFRLSNMIMCDTNNLRIIVSANHFGNLILFVSLKRSKKYINRGDKVSNLMNILSPQKIK